MTTSFLGETYALLAAMTWAMALVLFKRSGESIPPVSLSLFKNVVAGILFALTLLIASALPVESIRESVGLSFLASMHSGDLCILLLSGIVGIALADTLLFISLDRIGVGLVAVVECTYAPLVFFFAWLMLAEGVGPFDVAGGAMVLCGVAISSTHAPPPGRTRGQLLFGMSLGVVAIALMAWGIVLAKPVLEYTPLLPATMLRLAGGTVILAVLMAVSPRRRAHFAVFKPAAVWRTCIPASILGTYFAMIFWVGGFKYAKASVAAILNQTSTVFALVLATLILKEPFTRRKLAAAVVAFCGVAIVASSDELSRFARSYGLSWG